MLNIEDLNVSFKRNYTSKELEITECGRENCLSSKYNPQMCREYYIMHFVLHGSGVFIKEGEKSKPEKNEIFLIPPKTPVEYYPSRDNPWKYIWIGFRGSKAEEFINKTGFAKSDVVRVDGGEFGELFTNALESYNNSGILSLESLGYLYIIFSKLIGMEKSRDSSMTYKESVLREAVSYLSFNVDTPITINDLAKSLQLSRNYVIHLFSECLGISPKQYLINYRLEMGLKALKNGAAVTEAAKSVGYKSAEQFCKAFKLKYGVSPMRYAKKSVIGEIKQKKTI